MNGQGCTCGVPQCVECDGKTAMSPALFEQLMREIAKNGDTETAHGEADDLLCEVLSALGYDDGVQVYLEMEKWYA